MGSEVGKILACVTIFHTYFPLCFTSVFSYAASYQNFQGTQSDDDPNNTTVGIFVVLNFENNIFVTYL